MKQIPFIFLATGLLVVNEQCASARNMGVNIDYLYWNARQSDMVYAYVTNNLESFDINEAKFQTSDWASGMRLGAGYALPSCWDAYFTWTRYHNNFRSETFSGNIIANQFLTFNINAPFVGGPGIGGGPAISTWNLKFDEFALDFGATLYESRCFLFHPTFGIRGLIVNQRQFISYENFIDGSTHNFLNATANQVNNFWGIGPSAGFYGVCKLGCGFSFQGECSFAALYGRVPSHITTQFTELDRNALVTLALNSPFREFGSLGSGDPISEFVVNRNKIIPALQLYFGVDWGMEFSNCLTCDISVGYEVQYFWGLWRTQNTGIQNLYVTDAGYNGFGLDGVTFRVTLGF